MRENRTYGSEGGGIQKWLLPTPIIGEIPICTPPKQLFERAVYIRYNMCDTNGA